MCAIWAEFMPRYGHHFVACRFGDDLGFKSSLLTNPGTVRTHIIPQYRRVVDIVHAGGNRLLWHSCGCIFEIMEDVLAVGIDAKHSNEDAIAPFDRWIADYGDRIGLLGGFDMDFLCANGPDVIQATRFPTTSRQKTTWPWSGRRRTCAGKSWRRRLLKRRKPLPDGSAGRLALPKCRRGGAAAGEAHEAETHTGGGQGCGRRGRGGVRGLAGHSAAVVAREPGVGGRGGS
jgi:hypothetical protein